MENRIPCGQNKPDNIVYHVRTDDDKDYSISFCQPNLVENNLF